MTVLSDTATTRATSEAPAGPAGPPPTMSIENGYAYFQGAIVPMAEAKVSVATHALNYGTGCFEGIRGYWNEQDGQLYLLKLPEHYRRFLKSCHVLKIAHGLSVDDLCRITREVVRQCGYRQDVYVRPLAYKASAVIKVALRGLRDEVTVFAVPMGNYVNINGLRLMTSAWQRINDNAIPARSKVSGGYINAALAVDDAQQMGFDDAVMLTRDGHVSEATSANLFIVSDGRLLSPPVTDDILVGITRDAVQELARDLGLELEFRGIDRTELFSADEVFLCGTGVQIAPVTEIDHRTIGDGATGPVTAALQHAYFAAARGQDPRHMDWITPVYEG